MSCSPLMEMKVSQDQLKVMFERNKQLAQLNPGYHMGYAETETYPTSLKNLSPVPVLSKYRNVKVEYQGMMFDSGHELDCWKNLKLREKAGEIEDLKRQVKFELVVNGHRVGKITMDFTWLENDGRGPIVVADAKSEITRKETAYRLRKRIFEALYHPLTIREL